MMTTGLKKAVSLLTMVLLSVLGCLTAAADGASPATGEIKSIWPYVLLAVAVVLIVALVVLTILSKKKK